VADRKISDLTALTTPATGDLIPIVDVSEAAAADKNKSITVQELFKGVPDGTAAAPGLAFESDDGNGIFLAGTDQVGVATGGVERVEFGTSEVVFNDGGANYDFRIEGDTNTALFFVDASTDRVGIGTTSPGYNLQVAGTDPTFAINATNQSSSSVGTLLYRNRDGNGNTRDVCSIEGESAGNGGYGALAFHVAFNNSLLERARIDASGRLLVGTTTARTLYGVTAKSQIEGTDNTSSLSCVRNSNDGGGAYILLGKSRGTAVGGSTIVQDGDVVGAVYFTGADGTDVDTPLAGIEAKVDGTPGANDMPGRLVFSTTADAASSPTERMRIRENGETWFYNQSVTRPATDNAVSLGEASGRWSAVYAVNGTIQTSDQRLKTEIADSVLATDFIKSLRPVSYKWIEGGKVDSGERDEDNNYIYESVPGQRTHWGFIAQEVKQAVDDAGVDFGGWVLTDKDDPDSQQSLRYDQFIAPLTKALQEAIAKIETLEAKVAALEAN